jgi:hypothetical protein
MHKDTKSLINGMACGLIVTAIIFTPYLLCVSKDKERVKDANSVAWTHFTVDSWNSVATKTNGVVIFDFRTNGVEVSKIVLGLRKDGTVVWKEVLLGGHTNSYLMFTE